MAFTIPGRGQVSEPEFKQYWAQVFANDPQMKQIYGQYSQNYRQSGKPLVIQQGQAHALAAKRAEELGFQPPDQDWSLGVDNGQFGAEKAGFFARNADWLVPAIVGGATLGIGALGAGPAAGLFGAGGGGGATAAGGGAAAAGAGAGTGATAGTAAAGVTGATAAGAAIPTIEGTAIGTGMGVGPVVGAGASAAAAPSLLSRLRGLLPSNLGEAGQLLGQMAGSRADGRIQDINATALENRQTLDRSELENLIARDKFNAEMQRYQLDSQLPNLRASQVMKGGLMANAQDVRANHPRANVVHFEGGLRPSAFGPQRVEAGNRLAQIGLDKLGNESLPSAPNVTTPTLTPLPKAGVVDNILSWAGPAASLASLYNRRGTGATDSANAASTGAAPKAPTVGQPVSDMGGMTPEVTTSWGTVPQQSPIGNVTLPPFATPPFNPNAGPYKAPSGAQRFMDLLRGVQF